MRSVDWSGDFVDGPWSRRIKISYALFCHSVTDAFLSRQPEHQLKQTTPKFSSAYTRLTESFARNWVSQFLKSIYSNVSFTENYRNDSNKCPQLSVATDRDKTYHKIDSHIPHSWLACAALLQDYFNYNVCSGHRINAIKSAHAMHVGLITSHGATLSRKVAQYVWFSCWYALCIIVLWERDLSIDCDGYSDDKWW